MGSVLRYASTFKHFKLYLQALNYREDSFSPFEYELKTLKPVEESLFQANGDHMLKEDRNLSI